MEIEVVWGTAEGQSSLGAFDRALSDANVHNYNLVTLSSVVPAGGTVVERDALDAGRWDVGDPLAVVLADNTGTEPGETVSAGLGWLTAEEGGVFMEHAAGTAEECRRELERNLADARETRDWAWTGDPRTRVVETTVDTVASVVVCAVYRPLAFE